MDPVSFDCDAFMAHAHKDAHAYTQEHTGVNKGLQADVYPSTVDGTGRHKLFGWKYARGLRASKLARARESEGGREGQTDRQAVKESAREHCIPSSYPPPPLLLFVRARSLSYTGPWEGDITLT